MNLLLDDVSDTNSVLDRESPVVHSHLLSFPSLTSFHPLVIFLPSLCNLSFIETIETIEAIETIGTIGTS